MSATMYARAASKAALPSVAKLLGHLPVLLVFSQLRWGFVYQRRQQMLSRLAGRWRVIFVEEPLLAIGPQRMLRHSLGANLEVWVPHTPVMATGFDDEQLPLLEPMISDELSAAGVSADAVLVYTPTALPLSKALAPDAPLFYDCVGDHGSITDSQRLQQQEAALLEHATTVLTSGPSLYEAKRKLHPQVHCVPSAVDAAHFDPQRLQLRSAPAQAAGALQDALARPRLGYFGVVDERLDTVLLAMLADRHPAWQIVIAGPVVKIDPATLPQRANLHWLGVQPYERLPYLLAGWDVALMPFALNASTRFISPTKTLEYMAGEKPVVSTAVQDVISLYGHVVDVAHDHEAFVTACEKLLAEDAAARCRRTLKVMAAVSMVSWDRAAHYLDTLLQSAVQEQAQAAQVPLSIPALLKAAPQVASRA